MPISYEHLREEDGHFPLTRSVMGEIAEMLERVQQNGKSEQFPRFNGDVMITPDMTIDTAVYAVEESMDKFHLNAAGGKL